MTKFYFCKKEKSTIITSNKYFTVSYKQNKVLKNCSRTVIWVKII